MAKELTNDQAENLIFASGKLAGLALNLDPAAMEQLASGNRQSGANRKIFEATCRYRRDLERALKGGRRQKEG